MYVDRVLVYDSWSVYPRPVSPLAQHARPIDFVDCGYRFLRVEFFAMKPHSRSFHLEWTTPGAFVFRPVSASRLVLPNFAPFSYPVAVDTLPLGAPISLAPMLDPAVVSLATPHAFSADLPQGITLNPDTGVLSGCLPQSGRSLSIAVTLTLKKSTPVAFTTSLLFHLLPCLFTPLASPPAPELPASLEYHSGDLVVSELSVKTMDPLYLQPTGFPLTAFLFSVQPALPPGLVLDPTTGVIDGAAFVPLPRTLFTVTLSTPSAAWNCTLALEVKRITEVTSFYGTITRGEPVFFLNEDGAAPANDWLQVVADERGAFMLEVTKTIFWLRVPQGTWSSLSRFTRSEFSLFREDGSLFVRNGVWFSDNVFVPNGNGDAHGLNNNVFVPNRDAHSLSESRNCTTHTVFSKSGRKPFVSVSPGVQRVVVGVSITPVRVLVQGNHDSLLFDPPLPASLQAREFSERQEDQVATGYRVEGAVEEAGTVVFSVKVCNEEGCVETEFTLEVAGATVPRGSRVAKGDGEEYFGIADTIASNKEYYYTLAMDDEVLFKREDFASSWNVVSVRSPLQRTFTVHICRLRKWALALALTRSRTLAQQEFRLEILYQLSLVVFSTVFTASSVIDLYPCRRSAFRLSSVVTPEDAWRYYAGQDAPYNWRDSEYDDSMWSVGRGLFSLQGNDVLYLRKTVTVGAGAGRERQIDEFIDYSVVLASTLVREGVVVYVNNVEITRYNLGFELHPTNNYTTHLRPNNDATHLRPTNHHTHDLHPSNNHHTHDLHPSNNDTHRLYASASYLFRYPRYTSASFSHLYLQEGVNTIAVEIRRHLLSEPRVHFALQLLLLYTPEYQYSSSFPLVSSSVNVRAPRPAYA